MSRTIRFVGARIEFDFMVDDGATLEPFVMRQPDGSEGKPGVVIAARDWAVFCDKGLAEVTGQLQGIVDSTPADPPPLFPDTPDSPSP